MITRIVTRIRNGYAVSYFWVWNIELYQKTIFITYTLFLFRGFSEQKNACRQHHPRWRDAFFCGREAPEYELGVIVMKDFL